MPTINWYEVLTIVHDQEAHVESEFDDPREALEQAVELITALREDEDAASWSISLIAHSCDRTDACDCREKTIEAFRGLTVPDPWPLPSY